MRSPTPVVLALCTLVLAPLSAQEPGGRRRGRPPSQPVELKHFTYQEKSFHSDAVDRDMPYSVFLPEGYDDEANAKTTYPLVIWLHGMFEDHNRFHDRGTGAPVLDEMVGDGKLPPCIFVCANGGRTSMYVNRKDEKWEDLITKDLLGYLEKNYRVSPDRGQRALMGISMGGMAALKIAFKHPELFGTVAVHSSAVLPEDPADLPEGMKRQASRMGLDEVFGNPIEKDVWAQENPIALADKADNKSLKGLRIYFDAGTQDRFGFAAGNGELDKVLTKNEIDHTWDLVQGGGHAWGSGFKPESLKHSLAFVGQGFAAAAAAAKARSGLSGLLGGNGDKDGGKAPVK